MIEIVKTYRQSLPALRFIGKRYTDADRDQRGGYGKVWGEWFQNNTFAPLEQLGPAPEHEGAYVGLMTVDGGFAYWIGMFFPEGARVPEDYDHLDVPACDVGICWIRGREDNGEIYGMYAHNLCTQKMREAGYAFMENPIFFERYNCPRFTTPDQVGKVILDYGIEIKKEKGGIENIPVYPIEKLVQTISYKGVELEVVERPDVIWVGCVDYAQNNHDESDIGATLKRYREELINIPKHDLINPDWSAALSINYERGDKPCGIMFAQETYSQKQDERYDLFTQPGGLWLRIRNDRNAAALLGKESAEPYEYFAGQVLQNAAKENGYTQNPDVHVQVEYHCHAEYKTPPHTSFAYIPIVKG